MSGFASAKYAMRALSFSIAREFAPQGVHVAHAIIDGVIDIPRTKDWLKDMPPEVSRTKINGYRSMLTILSRPRLMLTTSLNRTGTCTRNQRDASPMR